MKVLGLLFALVLVVSSQEGDNDTDRAIASLFTTPKATFLPGYVEVTKKPQEGYGALEKCGEGADQGVHACVPYYNCDGITKTIITTGESDGFGVIDIRY